MTSAVRMTVQWLVRPQESGPIVAALHSLMMATRGEPGCVKCQVSTELGNHAGLRYEEEWKSEVDLQRQLRSGRFTRLIELVERATQHPQVEFALPGGARGLDYAEEVRRELGELQ